MGDSLQRILYIEDEPDIQRVVKIALEALGGFTVDVCSSGAEALRHSEQAPPPDLILLDVMMPEMDGPTTLRQLRALPALAHTPVIFMTAKVQPEEIAHFKALGALAVIAKPFDPMTLVQTLRDAWNGSRPVVLKGRFAERLQALTRQFHAELPQRRRELGAQWSQLAGAWDATLLAEFQRGVHGLAGSGSTFGLDEVTARARVLDNLLKPLLNGATAPAPAALAEIAAAFAALEQVLRAVPPA